MTIILAILVLGFLIFIHELGHYLTARMFKVGINEFAIGMGPKLVSWTSKKTGIAYSIRLLPIGGFVSLMGEDEESDDVNALNNKPVWQRMIIVSAGAFMNALVGVLIVLGIVMSKDYLESNIIARFNDDTNLQEYGFQVNDEIIKIDGKRVYYGRDMSTEIIFSDADGVDVVVLRDGEKVLLEDVRFDRVNSDGVSLGKIGFKVYPEEKNILNVLGYTVQYSKATVKMIWKSLIYMVTGKVGINQMSGPIGVTSAMGEIAKKDMTGAVNIEAMLA